MDFGDEIKIPMEHLICKTHSSYAFVNIRPFLPYHILVSPIRKVSRITEMTIDEYVDMMLMVRTMAECLEELGTSITVTLQDGPEAGQTVRHVHFHMIPRNKGDLVNNNDIYEKINIDVDRKNRSFEEMKNEAEFLRELVVKKTAKYHRSDHQ